MCADPNKKVSTDDDDAVCVAATWSHPSPLSQSAGALQQQLELCFRRGPLVSVCREVTVQKYIGQLPLEQRVRRAHVGCDESKALCQLTPEGTTQPRAFPSIDGGRQHSHHTCINGCCQCCCLQCGVSPCPPYLAHDVSLSQNIYLHARVLQVVGKP